MYTSFFSFAFLPANKTKKTNMLLTFYNVPLDKLSIFWEEHSAYNRIEKKIRLHPTKLWFIEKWT